MNFLEETAPVQLAEEWDNVGLLLGGREQEIGRILLCLDVTAPVVEEAIRLKVDLILSHHPLIFKGIKRIDEDHFKGSLITRLIRNNISVYSAHTNLDAALDGVNRVLADRIGLKHPRNLKDYKAIRDVFPRDTRHGAFGMGLVGDVPKPVFLEEFIQAVKQALDTPFVRVIGNRASEIRQAAVFCGSFDDDLQILAAKKADVLVTGDVKYHTAVDAVAMELCLIDAGHFHTEKVVLPELEKRICGKLPSLEVFSNKVEADPFKIY